MADKDPKCSPHTKNTRKKLLSKCLTHPREEEEELNTELLLLKNISAAAAATASLPLVSRLLQQQLVRKISISRLNINQV